MARHNTERPSYKGALGSPPPPQVTLVALTIQVPETTKRALKLAAVEQGTTVRAIADRALRTELGLEP
jgi:hypothetical protein